MSSSLDPCPLRIGADGCKLGPTPSPGSASKVCGACPLHPGGIVLTVFGGGTAVADHHDRARWPKVARSVAWLRAGGDRGIGDTVARLVAGVGGDTLAEWYERITGGSCGCDDRQAGLNSRYPY